MNDHIGVLNEMPTKLQLKHTQVGLCDRGFAGTKSAHVKSPKLERDREASSTNINTKHATLILIIFYHINNRALHSYMGSLF